MEYLLTHPYVLVVFSLLIFTFMFVFYLISVHVHILATGQSIELLRVTKKHIFEHIILLVLAVTSNIGFMMWIALNRTSDEIINDYLNNDFFLSIIAIGIFSILSSCIHMTKEISYESVEFKG